MASEDQLHLLYFDQFEIDLRTRELRQQGRLVKLQDLPVRLLILLATRAGEMVTREQIEQELWGDDHFVDFDHGINTAMRKIREALSESPEAPRFIETLPRKGYRFIAVVDHGALSSLPRSAVEQPVAPDANEADGPGRGHAGPAEDAGVRAESVAASNAAPEAAHIQPSEEFALPSGPARQLFLLTQAGYLLMYCVALFKLESAGRVMNHFFGVAPARFLPLLIAVAICGIAVRLFLLTSVGLKHPAAGVKYRKLLPAVLPLDVVWAASPLLLIEKLGMGLAIASIAGLAYLPFSQRILMNSIYPSK